MQNNPEADNTPGTIVVFFLLGLSLLFSYNHAYAQEGKSAQPGQAMKMPGNQEHSGKTAVEEHGSRLRLLAIDLYRLNPYELQKSASVSAEEMVQWMFEGPFGWKFDALREVQGVEALHLVFDPEFRGDRILALIVGIQTIIIAAYGGKTEFHFPDAINPQHLGIAVDNINMILSRLQNTENDMLAEGISVRIAADGGVLSTLSAIKQKLELDAAQHAGSP